MRKILVTLKRVVDYNVRVRVKPDGSGMAVDGLKMSVNPFDEIALEEALRMRERGEAGEILAVTRGDLAVIWGGAAVVLGLVVWRWPALLTATLSPELARGGGIDPGREQLVITIAIAVLVAVPLLGVLAEDWRR